MDKTLVQDKKRLPELLEEAKNIAHEYLSEIERLPVNKFPVVSKKYHSIPIQPIGASEALKRFKKIYYKSLTASSGPRSFGYVVGGSTPAALLGDWLTSAFDQDNGEGVTIQIEDETIQMLKELLDLPSSFSGSFVSGATMANFLGLACARQWVMNKEERDVAEEGLYGMTKIKVFSAAPHSSIYKSLSMLGMGRRSLIQLNTIPSSEAMDTTDLEKRLDSLTTPAVVVANLATVNATSFDNLEKIKRLKDSYPFWLHVDGAFGLLANCSPNFSHLLNGIESADSIAFDAHKWLNVPYDSGIFFTRHPLIQRYVFQNSNSPYLGSYSGVTDYMNRTPETSRRLRALPVWFSLLAYGKGGYRDIVERNCDLAGYLGRKITDSSSFDLLSPVNLNVVCFTLNGAEKDKEKINVFLSLLNEAGEVFMTSTYYNGCFGVRAAMCNWRTTKKDIDQVWASMLRTVQQIP